MHWKDWCWRWNSSTSAATWCEELTPWKRPRCWERLKAGGGDDRGRDGWMASPTQWTWIWTNSGRWWRTEESGMLQSMGSQRVGHNLATEQSQQHNLVNNFRGWARETKGSEGSWYHFLGHGLSVGTYSLYLLSTCKIGRKQAPRHIRWIRRPCADYLH